MHEKLVHSVTLLLFTQNEATHTQNTNVGIRSRPTASNVVINTAAASFES